MNNNTKNILLGVLIVGLIGMTVAYAALSTQLKITGTASVPNVTWDIKIKEFAKQANTPSVISGQTNTATGPASLTATNSTLISGLAVGFKQPGDKVVYTFKLANEGTIDAKLSSFSQGLTLNSGSTTSLTPEQIAAKFTSSIVCDPTEATTSDYLNKAGATAGSNHDVANCTLTIQWNEVGTGTGGQASQTAGQDQTFTQGAVLLDYNATWVYVQK